MNTIKLLSAENHTWNFKTADNHHTEAALNPLAVSGIRKWFLTRFGTGQ